MSHDELRARRIGDDVLNTHARRRRTRWAMAGAGAAVVAIAVPMALALRHSTSGGGGAGGPTGISDEARIYAAVIAGRPHAEVGRAAEPIYVIDEFCTGMIDIEGGKRGPCAAGHIPTALQQQIRRITEDRVRFTHSPPTPAAHSPMIRIGTATLTGDRAQVPVDVSCGPLCGQGDTKVVTRHGAEWRVTGVAGYAWIS